MARLRNWFVKKPVRFYLFAAILTFIVLAILDRKYINDWSDVLVEAHGLFFDLIVFGIILTIYDEFKSKKEKEEEEQKKKANSILRYEEEIDDLRTWNDKEATLRIVGIIKRLNKLGVTKFDLHGCHLEEANLSGINMSGTTFQDVNLKNAKFNSTILDDTFFYFCDMEETKFICCNLNSTEFHKSEFNSTRIIHSGIEKTKFLGVKFNELIVDETVFEQFNSRFEDFLYDIDKNTERQIYITSLNSKDTLIAKEWKLKKK